MPSWMVTVGELSAAVISNPWFMGHFLLERPSIVCLWELTSSIYLKFNLLIKCVAGRASHNDVNNLLLSQICCPLAIKA